MGFRRTGRNIIKPVRIAIRPAYRGEWDDAMALAWRTFLQFEAQDFTQAGVESFLEFITDTVLHKMFMMGAYQLFGAYDSGSMVGMISLRGETHISLLFVDERYHKMGIGRALIEYVSGYVLTEEGHRSITVNAAPYATGFYHRMGFVDTDVEQTSDGVRYTPMRREIPSQRDFKI
ncbi:MAG: GNAT family N-acetyltransferase [Lachnospiraceae bacterium]|nr:GNAT family N-acetyltransferase [Lachnospiraceae bacterium]